MRHALPWLLGVVAALGTAGAWYARKPDGTRALRLDAAFVAPPLEARAAWSPADWDAVLDELHALALDDIFIQAVARAEPTGGCEQGTIHWLPDWQRRLKAILVAAQARHQRLWLGGIANGLTCVGAWSRFVTEVMHVAAGADALVGFYVPDEPTPKLDAAELAAYARLRAIVRVASPLPVALAPYLLGRHEQPLQELAAQALRLRDDARFDLQLWQDSVGAAGGGMTPARQDTLRAQLAAVHDALDGHGFGTVTELFGAGALSSFTTPPAYAPTSAARLRRQLEALPEGAFPRAAWLPQKHMSASGADRYPGATRLRAAYLAVAERAGKLVPAASYVWTKGPAAPYLDVGNLITDGWTGELTRLEGAGWVGTLGDAQLVLRWPAVVDLAWVAVTLRSAPEAGVHLPRVVDLWCRTGQEPARMLVRLVAPTSDPAWHGEFVLGNEAPLGARCDELRLDVESTSWTFVSDVETLAP